MKKTGLLKKYILDPKILVMPGAHDALSARIIEKAGFKALFVGGYPATAALMGNPDISFLTLIEMVDHIARLTDTVDIPVFVDGDTGHGGVLNMARTARQSRSSWDCHVAALLAKTSYLMGLYYLTALMNRFLITGSIDKLGGDGFEIF